MISLHFIELYWFTNVRIRFYATAINGIEESSWSALTSITHSYVHTNFTFKNYIFTFTKITLEKLHLKIYILKLTNNFLRKEL